MEIFIRNLDPDSTDNDLKLFIEPLLAPDSVQTFHVRKTRKKGCAVLTIADVSKAQQFLRRYEQDRGAACFHVMNRQIYFGISRKSPDPWLLKVLQKNEKDRHLQLQSDQKRNKRTLPTPSASANLRLRALSCGRWVVHGSTLQYMAFSSDEFCGSLKANRWSLALTLDGSKYPRTRYEALMNFYDIQSIAVNPVAGQTHVTITLGVAPKIYTRESEPAQDLNSMLKAFFVGDDVCEPTKYRSRELGSVSSKMLATCLVYRLTVENGSDIFEEIKYNSMRAAPILISTPLAGIPAKVTLDDQILQLDHEIALCRFSYSLWFQLQRLWTNTYLSPFEVRSLLDIIAMVRRRSGDEVAAQVVRRLSSQIPYTGPETDPASLQPARLLELIETAEESLRDFRLSNLVDVRSGGNAILIHKVTVTPTGTYLEGPDEEGLNRVLRRYSTHADRFLRISFVEENGERIVFDRESSNEKIFNEGFQPILRNGVDIESAFQGFDSMVGTSLQFFEHQEIHANSCGTAGRHFEFLGFSHSSLRSQTCWFMAPFLLNDELLTARTVIQRLGDFSHIRSPAKCAARIGQAFSDSHSSITIDPSYVAHLAEVTNGNYTFSDGVGTFSPKIWSLICKQSNQSRYPDPTLYQIRFGGAKGMISLDCRLEGYQLCLRPSMIKYDGSRLSDIEICGSGLRPLPMRLNRQHIKILEDLGIESRVFERLQQEAIQKLRVGASSSQNAVSFLQSSLANGATQLPWLLKRLGDLEIDATDDAFIIDILSAIIQIELKELKYRARIPVEKAVTLYGIMDESKMLGEGQIYCTFSENMSKSVVSGRVAVTRSPALHPGDVQVVDAVSVPADSPLADLHNCVVFSTQGARDLPSQLSGGDLDGDLYNIIYDIDLLPKRCFPAADYTRAPSQDIGRPVKTSDMTDFFIDFMKNDQLGRIAILHQILADRLTEGTKSLECLKLAALHSTAVDFSKTGIRVDLKDIPRSPPFRPDFLAPGASTKIEKGISVRTLTSEDQDETDPRGYRYYESEKVLGTLYRSVDEDAFFEALEDDASSVFSRGSNCSVLEQVWRYVEMAAPSVPWRSYLESAAEIRDSYESSVIDSMFEFAFHRCHHLTEKEVFLGTIIAKRGAGTAHQRELAVVMKERFDREVRAINAWIRTDNDALERAIACLFVGKDARKDAIHRIKVDLVSFGWIVAATCLQEVEKYHST